MQSTLYLFNGKIKITDIVLEISGYVGTNATQPASAITMLQVMYLWLPFVFEILITILLSKMNVEAANEKLRREKGIE